MFKGRFERALHSRVARRIGLAFILSATLPLVGLALITTTRTQYELEAQAREALRADAKSAVNEGLGRLALFEEQLRLAGAMLDAAAPSAETDARALALFHGPPRVLFVEGSSGPFRAIPATMPPIELRADQRRLLGQTGALLMDAPPVVGGAYLVAVAFTTAGGPRAIVASIDESHLFGLDQEAFLPASTSLCVFGPRDLLSCSPSASVSAMREAAVESVATDQIVAGDTARYMAHVRGVPLTATHGLDPWRIVMTRPIDDVREPVRRFTRDFWLVALLSALVVAWVILSQIRKQLWPLDVLMEATERLKRQDFQHPVSLQSADEFQDLGEAFNALSAQLARQFADLEAFNLGTLDTLARAIDAKSHWTAGHSDRVMGMALAIGRTMGLPEKELLDLRRGSPVHDIGKLATPAEVLDKPGPLTPDEFAVMKEHTTKGVHILAPIAAFRRLLPIVGQHHERWDGGGYPRGLKGTAIARTARVLAVADVYDAMRSDRPYRSGMPQDEVVRAIAAAAGTHFDPAVVAAFLEVAATIDVRPSPEVDTRTLEWQADRAFDGIWRPFRGGGQEAGSTP